MTKENDVAGLSEQRPDLVGRGGGRGMARDQGEQAAES